MKWPCNFDLTWEESPCNYQRYDGQLPLAIQNYMNDSKITWLVPDFIYRYREKMYNQLYMTRISDITWLLDLDSWGGVGVTATKNQKYMNPISHYGSANRNYGCKHDSSRNKF